MKITPLARYTAPLGREEIELEEIVHDAGGMALLRVRIRERKRFTIFDIDPATLERRVADPVGDVFDVAFDLAGGSLPADYAWALAEAIGARLPWFAEEPLAGVHPLRAAPTAYGVVLLARRAKLVLRIPGSRLAASLELQHAELEVAGNALRVGAGDARALRASPTVSASRVVTGAETAAEFESDVRRVLDALAVECALISGRRRQASAGERTVAGFALSLAGLSPRDSLWIQRVGIGGERRLGWGVFVPAKAITPADEP